VTARPALPAVLLRAARRRLWLDTAAVAAPLLAAAAALGWVLLGAPGLIALALVGALGGWLAAGLRARRITPAALAARLDGSEQQLEDSAELLFEDAAALAGLAALQRTRLEQRLAEGLALDPRPPWSRGAIGAAWAAGACAAALLLLAPWPGGRMPRVLGVGAGESAAGAVQITGLRLRITPPAYTKAAAREQTEPDVKAPAGALLEWRVRFSSPPAAAEVEFASGPALPLRREGDRWIGARPVERSTLYRIEAQGAPRQPWRRIEAVADAPPVVRPAPQTARLTLVQPGQTRWTPEFEALDDYGLEPIARLRVTTASGDGEQISVATREAPLRGTGEGKRMRWSAPLELAREGLAPGGDLIVQLIVRDNRRPTPHEVEGPSVILRQPSQQALADGLDGLLVPTLPAFFRSQRQIILDAEALLRARSSLSAEAFAERSYALGADQAALRLRYGQFVGEEGPEGPAPPTNDAPAAPPLPTNDSPAPEPAPAPARSEHFAGDGHDHGAEEFAEPGRPGGAIADAARRFGHVHDQGEAATLFSPGTRTLLAQMLDAMWGSERALRQARPDEALPFARRALEALKQAQQATRIYLSKTGSRLPPLDLARRLTGKREGIAPERLEEARAVLAPELAQVWRALEERPGAPAPQLDALEQWLLANPTALADPLALRAAIEAVRLDPACADCREALRAALWDALRAQPPTAQRRAGADAVGARYLEALQ
jgi:hypothetical protein